MRRPGRGSRSPRVPASTTSPRPQRRRRPPVGNFFFGLPLMVQATLKGLAVILIIFPVAAACSMAERKVSAWIQGRPGPNRALPPFLAWVPGISIPQRLGLFQLAADGAKFLFKEEPLPDHVNRLYYTLAPVVAMVPAFTTVTVVPFGAYLDSAGGVVPLVLANRSEERRVG